MFTILALIGKFKFKMAVKTVTFRNKLQNMSSGNTTLKKSISMIDKITTGLIILGLVVDIFLVVLFASFINNRIAAMACVASNVVLNKDGSKDEESLSESEYDTKVEDGLSNSGGIYPKDPILKSRAKLLELISNCENYTNDDGFNDIQTGLKLVDKKYILGALVRETSSKIFSSTQTEGFDFMQDLLEYNPACTKSSCKYIKGGVSHFVNGTVVDGVDKGDPRYNWANTSPTDYNKFGGDHALSLAQFECQYVGSHLLYIYPTGSINDKTKEQKIGKTNPGEVPDDLKMDNTLGFIRPNIMFVPDIVLSCTKSHRWYDKDNWLMKSDEYLSLNERNQTFIRACINDTAYGKGMASITEEDRKFYQQLAKLVVDGKVEYLDEMADDIADTIYDKKTKMNKANMKDVCDHIANKYGLKYSGSSSDARWYGVYASCIGKIIWDGLEKDIASAEKDVKAGSTLNPIQGISSNNFVETPGIGQGTWDGKTAEELFKSTKYFKMMQPYFGTSVASVRNDKFNWRNTKLQTPIYSQWGGTAYTEEWKGTKPDGLDMFSFGCHIYMMAYMTSSIQQRIVNPAETICAMKYLGLVNSSACFESDPIKIDKYFKMLGYRSISYSNSGGAFTDEAWKSIDIALDNNLAVGVRMGKGKSQIFTNDSHFLCITEKDKNGNYLLVQQASSKSIGKSFSKDELKKNLYLSSGERVVLIVPYKQ